MKNTFSATLAPLRDHERDDYLRFMGDHLKDGGHFRDIWNWRLSEPDHSGGEIPFIARADATLLGTVGVIPMPVSFQGRRFQACWQLDSVVSPKARGMGLGKRLVNRAAEGWDLVLAKGTSTPMYGLRKSLGYRDVRNSDYLVRIFQPRGIATVSAKKALLEELAALWARALPSPGATGAETSIEPISSFDASFDQLADEQAREPVFRPRKDAGYLNWRYFKCPLRQYRIFRAGRERALGAIVIKTGPGNEEGWIVDMVSSSTGVTRLLIQAALEYFRDHRVARVWSFCTHGPSRRALLRQGFVPTGITPRFTCSIRSGGALAKLLPQSPWDFWHGDGDIELYM